ncbi:MAG: hypothetical protein H7X94_07845, partial [Vallitaleaceae bacterium]|nr:hypothetical protein [Vallitaleaceae bacterium]
MEVAKEIKLGVIVDNLRESSELFWQEMELVSQIKQVQLIILPLEMKMSTERDQMNFHQTLTLQYINSNILDGLIVLTNTIAIYPSYPLFENELKKIKHIPVVSVGTGIEGFPSVLLDNYSGVNEAMDHLVEDHGYRRIAFIKGAK